MTQFAPVAPIQILEEMLKRDKNLFGDYHLMLAHHTVEFPGRFRQLVIDYTRPSAIQARNITIIMDNSIVELGGAVDDVMIAQAVDIVQQNNLCTVIPCLPDVMGDGKGTRELSDDAYHRWSAKGMPGDGYMVVTQGESWTDFCKTVNHFFVENHYPKIRWVGIPRKLISAIGTRRHAIEYIQMVAPHVNIHLLGFSDNISDDLRCARLPGIRGIDSAVPVRYDALLTPITTDQQIGPRGDWMETGRLTNWNQANIRNVRKWIRAS